MIALYLTIRISGDVAQTVYTIVKKSLNIPLWSEPIRMPNLESALRDVEKRARNWTLADVVFITDGMGNDRRMSEILGRLGPEVLISIVTIDRVGVQKVDTLCRRSKRRVFTLHIDRDPDQ